MLDQIIKETIRELLVGGKTQKQTNSNYIQDNFIDKYCIIRTYSAGVHYGYVRYYDSQTKDVVLEDARRIHSWSGAFTLSAIANGTIDLKNSRISEKVKRIKLTEIEILPFSEKGHEVLEGAATHEI